VGQVTPSSSSQRPAERPWQYSISGLLIVTTVVAVCLGALRVAPGLGILLIIVLAVSAVPATIRANVIRQRSQGPDSPRARLAYLESFAVTAAAITVGIFACGVVAIVACIVGCGFVESLRNNQVSDNVAFVLLFASPVIGLIVAGLIYWLAWPKRQLPG
jgi:phosphate/sulfate permease